MSTLFNGDVKPPGFHSAISGIFGIMTPEGELSID